MAGISVSGLGSGLNVSDIVSQLISADSVPLTNLAKQATKIQAHISNLGTLKSAYSQFQGALQSLANPNSQTALRGLTASSSDTSILSASVSGDTPLGTYNVTASTLATRQSLVSNTGSVSATAALTTTASTLSINLGTISGATADANGQFSDATFTTAEGATPFQISIPAGSSLNDIAKAINKTGSGVSAGVVYDGSKYRLTLSSSNSGVNNSIKITTSGSDSALDNLVSYDPEGTQNLKQTVAASDFTGSLNGIPITSHSNTLTENVPGLSINVAKAGTSTVTVGQSSSAVASSLGALITSWNTLNTLSNNLTSYNPDTKVGGDLQSDARVKSAAVQTRSALFGSSFNTGSNYNTLMSIGISVDAKGVASLDNAKLSAALKADPNAVSNLFSKTGGDATSKADTLLKSLTGSTGFDSSIASYNTQLKANTKAQTAMQTRLEAQQISLTAQFSSLDTLVSKFNNISTYLTKQFA